MWVIVGCVNFDLYSVLRATETTVTINDSKVCLAVTDYEFADAVSVHITMVLSIVPEGIENVVVLLLQGQ